jgi:hypothetical protein
MLTVMLMQYQSQLDRQDKVFQLPHLTLRVKGEN